MIRFIFLFICILNIAAANHPILEDVILPYLEKSKKFSSEHIAKILMQNIDEIGQKILEKDFLLQASNMNQYCCYSIWEGKKYNIPITFFIFSWPSEKYTQSSQYKTPIHSHPIPCAFVVLKGSLIQETFNLKNGKIQCINKELFKAGNFEIDDAKSFFIHRLFSIDIQHTHSFSLHAYGLSSEEEVFDCFNKTSNECVF